MLLYEGGVAATERIISPGGRSIVVIRGSVDLFLWLLDREGLGLILGKL